MICFFAFNLGVKDFSGLPTYSEQFLNQFEKKDMCVFNIVYDRHKDFEINYQKWGEHTWVNCFLPRFLDSWYGELPGIIQKVMEDEKVDNVIIPDYLMESYMEKIPLKKMGIKKTLFIHLLYRGMMDCFTKQPYFESHISLGMEYMAKIAFLEWKAVVTSDTIICNSEFTANQLMRFYWEDIIDSNIYTAILGVDKKSVPYLPANDSKKWGYFGRLETQKGTVWWMKDFATNKELYKKNKPIVCGSGSQTIQFYDAMFQDNIVEYYGNVQKEELWTIFKDVKFCIFPSIYEPYGLALNEAMLMGKICIVSNVASGMLEQIVHGKNAIIFDFQKNSIVKFIEDLNSGCIDFDFDMMSKNARKDARNNKEHFKKLEKLIWK